MNSFLTFINQLSIDFKREKTLLAVSGGADSIVMAHLFYKMGFPAGIAHCNFGLRDEDSEEDEQFVKSIAEKYGFEFFTTRFQVKDLAKEKGISTQMAARELRYRWFEEVRKSNDYNWIATAHHVNDSFETVLLNLARGTGLAGLHGISAINDNLLRPLLYMTKDEILAYASEQQLAWREDSSNETDDYRRNLLRHQVMPIFKQINPSLEKTFRSTSEKLESVHSLLNGFLQSWEKEVVRSDAGTVKIDIDKVLVASESGYRLWFLLEKYGFTYTQVGQILQSLGGNPGKVFFSDGFRLLLDRNELILEPRQNTEIKRTWIIHELPDEFTFDDKTLYFEKKDRRTLQNTMTDCNTILMDTKNLIFPLTIRNWLQGDRFYPFGMHGKQKKVSDLFTDSKLDRFEKEKVRILLNGDGDIIWVMGLRFDERFKIKEDSREILSITVRKPITS